MKTFSLRRAGSAAQSIHDRNAQTYLADWLCDDEIQPSFIELAQEMKQAQSQSAR